MCIYIYNYTYTRTCNQQSTQPFNLCWLCWKISVIIIWGLAAWPFSFLESLAFFVLSFSFFSFFSFFSLSFLLLSLLFERPLFAVSSSAFLGTSAGPLNEQVEQTPGCWFLRLHMNHQESKRSVVVKLDVWRQTVQHETSQIDTLCRWRVLTQKKRNNFFGHLRALGISFDSVFLNFQASHQLLQQRYWLPAEVHSWASLWVDMGGHLWAAPLQTSLFAASAFFLASWSTQHSVAMLRGSAYGVSSWGMQLFMKLRSNH